LTVSRAEAVAAARGYVGTPFQHQGRAPGVAMDCAGVLICVARELGIVEPTFDVTGYGRRPDGVSLLAECDRWMTRIARRDMQPGDVIVVRHEHDPQHIGILGDYLHGGLSMIHALGTPDGRGRVIEHRLDAGTLSRFIAAYRLPGVA